MPQYITFKQFQQLRQSLDFLPKRLEKITVWCDGCKAEIPPPWLQKCTPLERLIADNGVNWVPGMAHFDCPKCQTRLALQLPRVKQTGGYCFFGDEAHRNPAGLHLTTYSLVGTLNRDLHLLEEALQQVKRRVEPNVPPSDWKIHMKKLWSGDERQRSGMIYAAWGQEKVQALCNELFSLIKNYGSTLMVANASGIVHMPGDVAEINKIKNYVRDQVYLALVYNVIDIATEQGVRPRFVFDGEVKRKDGTYAQPWAAGVINGAKLNLVYPFIARGMRIDDPEVVTPASHAGLELADFVSFVIARFLDRKLQGKTMDFNPACLGKVHYVGFTPVGDVLMLPKNRYPWGEFYGSA